jgi:hypothetical protein
MPYIKQAGTDRLTLPSAPDYYVLMKSKATYADKLASQKAMMQVSQVDLATLDPAKAHLVEADMESGRGVLTEIEIDAFFKTLLERLIVSWNIDGEDGEVLPITQETIGQLDPDDGDFLTAAARKRLGGRPSAADRPFVMPSPPPSLVTKSSSRTQSKR